LLLALLCDGRRAPASRSRSVNLEHWDWEVPPGAPVAVSPMGGPEGLWSGNQPQFPDIGGWGNHEYGNRVGIFRILDALDKYGITPTLALDKAASGRVEGHWRRDHRLVQGARLPMRLGTNR